MKRLAGSWAVVAVMLAALLPLQQAHCLWMSRMTPVAAATHGKCHSGCCAASTGTHQQHRAGRPECPCLELPSSTLPAAVPAPAPPMAAPLAVSATATILATQPTITAYAPVVELGSPPLPIDCSAHGLRAPPLA
jgi:hypothetical protein